MQGLRIGGTAAALARALGVAMALGASSHAFAQDDDARRYIVFVEEFAGTCTARNGVQILVKSSHPTRKLRVWLDRYYMNVGTGDRSRTDLAPGGEPDALGCSRSLDGVQEWRIVRAQFID